MLQKEVFPSVTPTGIEPVIFGMKARRSPRKKPKVKHILSRINYNYNLFIMLKDLLNYNISILEIIKMYN